MGKHLNLSQRIIIEGILNEGNNLRKIGEIIGKPHSTISRKILVAIYNIFVTEEVWNPTDLTSIETPIQDKIKFTKNNFNQSFKQSLSLRLTSEELIELINQNANKLPI